MKNVLMIENDQNIIELVDIHLKDIHCRTPAAKKWSRMYQPCTLEKLFDLIILDVMLPDIDGIEICRRLRAEKIISPIIMLTARSEEIDKIIGFETGADDYLTKPFNIRELIARIKANLRRSEISLTKSEALGTVVRCGKILTDPEKRKVMVRGSKIELTPKGFDLLYLFASNPGKSYSREALLNKVWGHEFKGYEHTVNSHINGLRIKIESDL